MAMRIACLMVSAREPTEVPMALATSLAPTPQAMKKPKRQARMSRTVPYSVISVIFSTLLDAWFGLPLAGHQQFQAVAYALGAVSDITNPFDDLIQEHHVYRR